MTTEEINCIRNASREELERIVFAHMARSCALTSRNIDMIKDMPIEQLQLHATIFKSNDRAIRFEPVNVNTTKLKVKYVTIGVVIAIALILLSLLLVQ